MTLSGHYISEPLLEFAHGQKLEHPQDGLFLYGPVDLAGSPEVLRVGVIGATEGIHLVKGWLAKLAAPLPVKDPSKLHTSPWPGFQAAFGARLPLDPLATITLSRSAIETAARKSNRTDAVRSTVALYENALLEHKRTQETRPDVWFVVIPEIVHDYGRPTVTGPRDNIPSQLMSEGMAKANFANRRTLCRNGGRSKDVSLCAKFSPSVEMSIARQRYGYPNSQRNDTRSHNSGR